LRQGALLSIQCTEITENSEGQECRESQVEGSTSSL
jgi:hypothetical protein